MRHVPAARMAPLLAAALLIGACSSGSGDAPGAVSADEAAQLNDAAAMLDANSIDINAIDATTNESTAP